MTTEPDESPLDVAEAVAVDIGNDATVPGDTPVDGASAPRRDGPVAPERIGRYRVLNVLGSGGMGRVYEAVDDRLDRRVAVKVLHEHLSEDHRRRLVREAQALARLSHPNVVHVYEVEEADDEMFVAMELVRGQSLQQWVQRDPRPDWRACVEVYLQAGAGLQAAHAEGLVHRDFKPGNAIIDAKGRVRVLDFGLARQAAEREPAREEGPAPNQGDALERAAREGLVVDGELAESCLTTTGTMLGTPAYMSLEQMLGGDVDARSDQFSFCVALYEAVYGERPFSGDTIAALMGSVIAGRIRPAPKGTAVPAKLRQALLRGLAREPGGRWPTMEELVDELQGRIAHENRRWFAIGLAGVLVAVGLGAGYYATRTGSGADETIVSPADPVDDDVQQAALLYEAGKLAFRQGLFDEAVESFSKSYELSENSLLLYNLAVALKARYEISNDVEDLRRARMVMKNYLMLAEQEPEVDAHDVNDRIAELDAMIAEAEARPEARKPAAGP